MRRTEARMMASAEPIFWRPRSRHVRSLRFKAPMGSATCSVTVTHCSVLTPAMDSASDLADSMPIRLSAQRGGQGHCTQQY
jgi:hypothetical protein